MKKYYIFLVLITEIIAASAFTRLDPAKVLHDEILSFCELIGAYKTYRYTNNEDIATIIALRLQEDAWDKAKELAAKFSLNEQLKFAVYKNNLEMHKKWLTRQTEKDKALLALLTINDIDTSAEKKNADKWSKWVKISTILSIGPCLYSLFTRVNIAVSQNKIVFNLPTWLALAGGGITLSCYFKWVYAEYSLWSKKRTVPDIEHALREKRRELKGKYASAIATV